MSNHLGGVHWNSFLVIIEKNWQKSSTLWFYHLLPGRTTSTESNHPYFLRVTNVRKKFHSDSFFSQELHLCWPDSYAAASLNIFNLISSSDESVVRYPLYPHNLHSLPLSLPLILHISLLITISTVPSTFSVSPVLYWVIFIFKKRVVDSFMDIICLGTCSLDMLLILLVKIVR